MKLKLHTLRPAVVLYKGMYAHTCFFIDCHLSDHPGPTTKSEQSMVRRLHPLSIGCRQHLIIIIEHLGMAACKGYVDKAVGSQLQIAEIHSALA